MNNNRDKKMRDQTLESKEELEKMWDHKAHRFNKNQYRQGQRLALKVKELLNHKRRLTNQEVLDVGGGTGLYAIPFASIAKNVTITDLSTNMLMYAKENADKENCRNLQFVKLDWKNANLKELQWENRFDLVYASMCPAIKSNESLEKMIAASKNWCCVNRIIETKDHVTEKLTTLLGPSNAYDPQNDRELTQTIFNYLWENGYEPELDYIKETTEKSYTIEEAVGHYGKSYAGLAQEQNVDLREVISSLGEYNQLKVLSHQKLALLSWQVK